MRSLAGPCCPFPSLDSQRGEGKVGCIIGLIVLIVVAYFAIVMLPSYINMWEFKDMMEEEAKFAAVRKDADEIKHRLLTKAKELELPIGEEQVDVKLDSKRVEIEVKYRLIVDTIFKEFVFDRHETVKRDIFI